MWLTFGGLVVIAALIFGAAVAGWSYCKYRTERGLAAKVQELERQRADLERQIGEMAVALSKETNRVRAVYRDLRREVERREREVPNRMCLDDGDVRLLNAAARGEGVAAVPEWAAERPLP